MLDVASGEGVVTLDIILWRLFERRYCSLRMLEIVRDAAGGARDATRTRRRKDFQCVITLCVFQSISIRLTKITWNYRHMGVGR